MSDCFEEWYQGFVTSMGKPVKGYCRPARTEKEVAKAAYSAGQKSPKREISEEAMAEYIYNGRHKPSDVIKNPWKHLLGFHGTDAADDARKYRDVARLAIEAFSKAKS